MLTTLLSDVMVLTMPWYSQTEFQSRFEWGLEGARRLSNEVDVAVVVDILSFSTCVEIAVSSGAEVFPYLFKDDRAKAYALSQGAKCASPERSKTEICLSPPTLARLSIGDRIVLPSPNGSTISFSLENTKVLCGCLRNAKAVAAAASKLGKKILVIAAGEQWADGLLRPSIEDMIGAGAILSYLLGNCSPEAFAAVQVFQSVKSNLKQAISESSSGRELIERGFSEDNESAALLNVSETVPILRNKAFTRMII